MTMVMKATERYTRHLKLVRFWLRLTAYTFYQTSFMKKFESGALKRKKTLASVEERRKLPKIKNFFASREGTAESMNQFDGPPPLLIEELSILTSQSELLATDPQQVLPFPSVNKNQSQGSSSTILENPSIPNSPNPTSSTTSTQLLPPTDPALWQMSNNLVTALLAVGSDYCRNRDGVYATSVRHCKDRKR
jgi:hypothetical protein